MDLEHVLGGPVYYTRKTRQIAPYLWEPYGEVFVARADSVLRLPFNQQASSIKGFVLWGDVIIADLEEIDDLLPYSLTHVNNTYQCDTLHASAGRQHLRSRSF